MRHQGSPHQSVSGRRGAEGGPRAARTEPPQHATPDARPNRERVFVGGHAQSEEKWREESNQQGAGDHSAAAEEEVSH